MSRGCSEPDDGRDPAAFARILAGVKHPTKLDFPVGKVRRYLEPGPIVLVSSHWDGKHNVMTLGWHTVLEFSPSLVGCMISGGNYTFDMIRKSCECVINL